MSDLTADLVWVQQDPLVSVGARRSSALPTSSFDHLGDVVSARSAVACLVTVLVLAGSSSCSGDNQDNDSDVSDSPSASTSAAPSDVRTWMRGQRTDYEAPAECRSGM